MCAVSTLDIGSTCPAFGAACAELRLHLLSHCLVSTVASDTPRFLLSPRNATVLANSLYSAECVGFQSRSRNDRYQHYVMIPPNEYEEVCSKKFPVDEGFPVHTLVASPEYDQSTFICGFGGEIGVGSVFIHSNYSCLTVHGEQYTHSCLRVWSL